jgi:hypothetical protein
MKNLWEETVKNPLVLETVIFFCEVFGDDENYDQLFIFLGIINY